MKKDEAKIDNLNKLVKELSVKKEGKSYRLHPNTPVRVEDVPESKQLYVLTNYVKESALSALIKWNNKSQSRRPFKDSKVF
jgi:hypothetical protein